MVGFNEMLSHRKAHFKDVHENSVHGIFSKEHKALDMETFKSTMRSLMKDSNNDALKHGRRRQHIPSNAQLESIFNDTDTDKSGFVDEAEFMALYNLAVEGKVKALAGGFSYYQSPTQHRHWGDHELHMDQDWQDLYFDLLFVGGAYKVGTFLMDGIIYHPDDFSETVKWFLIMNMVIAQQWFMKLNIQARFQFKSFLHGILIDLLEFSFVALAIWNIPGAYVYVEVKENHESHYSAYSAYSSAYSSRDSSYSASIGSYSASSEHHRTLAEAADGTKFSTTQQLIYNVQSQTMYFSLFVALNNALHIFKWCEVLYMDDCTSGARTIAKFMMTTNTVICIMFALATWVAFSSSDYGYYNNWAYDNDGSKYCMYLWLAGVAVYFTFFLGWASFLNSRDDYKACTVPLSVNYVIHRIGEFAMLMIGESVLSLLTVPVEDQGRSYSMFFGGMLIATHLCFQHYAVYPTNPRDHVLRGARFNHDGVMYLFVQMYVYSTVLIMIGVASKSLLKEATLEEVMEDANWMMSLSLLTAFLCLNFFSFLHNQEHVIETITSRGDNFTRKHLLAAGLFVFIIVLFLSIGYAGLRPARTMLLSCFVVMGQSILMVTVNKNKLRSDGGLADHESTAMDSHQKVHDSEFVAARHEFKEAAAKAAKARSVREQEQTREAVKNLEKELVYGKYNKPAFVKEMSSSTVLPPIKAGKVAPEPVLMV